MRRMLMGVRRKLMRLDGACYDSVTVRGLAMMLQIWRFRFLPRQDQLDLIISAGLWFSKCFRTFNLHRLICCEPLKDVTFIFLRQLWQILSDFNNWIRNWSPIATHLVVVLLLFVLHGVESASSKKPKALSYQIGSGWNLAALLFNYF